MSNIANKVMQEIHKKGIRMRPRAYFLAGSLLLTAGLMVIFFIATFLFNIISFRLRVDAPHEFLRFGPPGMLPFFRLLPWLPLLIAVSLVFVGIHLLKKYEFSFKHNFAVIAAITIFLVIAAGFIIDRIGASRRLEILPPIKGFYQERLPGENWVIGEILEISGDSVRIKSLDGRKIVVILNETTMLPMGRNFKVGESIRAFGKWQDSVLHAEGIMGGGFLKHPTLFPPDNRHSPSPDF